MEMKHILLALFGVLVLSGFAYAYGGLGQGKEAQATVLAALQNGTYSDWVDAVTAASRPHILDVINESNFANYQQMQSYVAAGDFQNASVIAKELGLPPRPPMHPMGGRMPGNFRPTGQQ